MISAELLAMGMAILGLLSAFVEKTIAELDPIEISEIFRSFFNKKTYTSLYNKHYES